MNATFGYFDERSYRIAQVRVQVVRELAAPLPTSKAVHPSECADFFRSVVAKSEWFDAEKECVVVLLLDRKFHIRGWNLLTLGTQTASLVSPVEVLRAAIVGNATAFVLMHNHPSGDPAPSAADLNITRLVRDAAKAVAIDFLDHVIIGTPEQDPLTRGHWSFREAGLL